MEKKEIQETQDVVKGKYVATVMRDEKLLKLYVKFYNKVRHPRVTMYMTTIGALLIALPIANKEIALPGVIVCYIMGPILMLLGLFRHVIGVKMLKDNPETQLGEKLTYIFGNTDIKISKENKLEKFSSYANVYRLWENEKIFYIGANEDDLAVIPKENFETGDVSMFREFLLDKTGCIYTWQPTRIDNVIKNNIASFKWRMQKQQEEADAEEQSKK